MPSKYRIVVDGNVFTDFTPLQFHHMVDEKTQEFSLELDRWIQKNNSLGFDVAATREQMQRDLVKHLKKYVKEFSQHYSAWQIQDDNDGPIVCKNVWQTYFKKEFQKKFFAYYFNKQQFEIITNFVDYVSLDAVQDKILVFAKNGTLYPEKKGDTDEMIPIQTLDELGVYYTDAKFFIPNIQIPILVMTPQQFNYMRLVCEQRIVQFLDVNQVLEDLKELGLH